LKDLNSSSTGFAVVVVSLEINSANWSEHCWAKDRKVWSHCRSNCRSSFYTVSFVSHLRSSAFGIARVLEALSVLTADSMVSIHSAIESARSASHLRGKHCFMAFTFLENSNSSSTSLASIAVSLLVNSANRFEHLRANFRDLRGGFLISAGTFVENINTDFSGVAAIRVSLQVYTANWIFPGRADEWFRRWANCTGGFSVSNRMLESCKSMMPCSLGDDNNKN